MTSTVSRMSANRIAALVGTCDNRGEMPARSIIVLVVLLSMVVAPVAMAAEGCAGMGPLCGAPGSPSYVSVSPVLSDVLLAPTGSLAASPRPDIPGRGLETLDAPPKFPSA